MAFEFHLHIPEDSQHGRVIQTLAAQLQISPQEAAEKVFEDGLNVQLPPHKPGNIWGIGAEDAGVLDEIVSEAMAERRDRFVRRLDA